jgi:ATP-dependent Clp protease adapter protein ClpS
MIESTGACPDTRGEPRYYEPPLKLMAEKTLERIRPDLYEHEATEQERDYIVIVFDNPVNTWEQVIQILQEATGCSFQEAYNETWEVHHQGRSVVHHGGLEECNRAAAIIRTIGIEVTVEQV